MRVCLGVASGLEATPGARDGSDPGPDRPPLRPLFPIILPAELGLSYETEVPPTLAVSPTGDTVAIVADGEASRRLFLRDLGDFGLRVVEGSEGAGAPFSSPDDTIVFMLPVQRRGSGRG